MTFTYRHFAGHKANHAMIAINSAPETGHRDAAFDCAAAILNTHLFALPAEKRLETYQQAMELLHISITCTTEIHNASEGNKHDHEANVLSFLNLLYDTIHAAATLLSHQQTMVEEDKKVTDFFGFDLAFHFQNTDEVLADSEINIIQCIKEMLARSHERLMQYRGHCCRTLSGKELKRYHKAFAEYQQLYSQKFQMSIIIHNLESNQMDATQLIHPNHHPEQFPLNKTEKLPPQH